MARLTLRLVRRGALVLVFALAAYTVLEVRAFEAAYPDEASRTFLTTFGEDPVVRILQGVPAGSSISALVMWDAGWMLQLIVAVWLIATTGRLLRGDEEAGRADLVLAGPTSARRVLTIQLAVLLGVAGLAGLAVAASLAATGAAVVGALEWGGLLAGVGATFVVLAAVLSQLLASRGRVVGIAATVLGASFVLRMVANSAESRAWVAWLTPLGWADRLGPFGDDRPMALAVPLGVVTGIAVVAVLLRRGRDTGAGIGREGRARSRLVGLTSPLAFATRTSLGVLVAWLTGLVAYCLVIGALLPSLENFVEPGSSYARMLESFGLNIDELSKGFVGFTGTLIGVVVCLYVAWRIGAARTEEATGRLDHFLVRPVGRLRWLGGQVLLTVLCVSLLTAASGLAVWAGAMGVGADLAVLDALAAVANPLPAVAVFLGLAVLLVGVAPRSTVAVGASLPVLAYVLEVVGPPLDWPELVLDLSPFHHLGAAPLDPVGFTAAALMVAIGLVLGLVGAWAFRRRDIVGA